MPPDGVVRRSQPGGIPDVCERVRADAASARPKLLGKSIVSAVSAASTAADELRGLNALEKEEVAWGLGAKEPVAGSRLSLV